MQLLPIHSYSSFSLPRCVYSIILLNMVPFSFKFYLNLSRSYQLHFIFMIFEILYDLINLEICRNCAESSAGMVKVKVRYLLVELLTNDEKPLQMDKAFIAKVGRMGIWKTRDMCEIVFCMVVKSTEFRFRFYEKFQFCIPLMRTVWCIAYAILCISCSYQVACRINFLKDIHLQIIKWIEMIQINLI